MYISSPCLTPQGESGGFSEDVAALGGGAGAAAADPRALSFILAQLCGLVCPEKPEPDHQLLLSKAPSQEEFIRGEIWIDR